MSLAHASRAAALTGVGYYAAAVLGVGLRFPPATTSIVWPPNAVLTAALLLVPPRYWWVCLLAAAPPHFLVELNSGFPLATVAPLFVTNCLEAVIGAGSLRLVSDAPRQLDTLRRAGLFIGCVVLAGPILSSFADAGVVHLTRGEDYWTVWRTRVFGNTLTELSVVPLVLCIAAATRQTAREWFRQAPATSVILIGLAIAAAIAVGVLPPAPEPAPNGQWPDTLAVMLLLPLFFWGAMRLGPGGLSFALLLCTLVASYAATTGHRPFEHLLPGESLIALQLYLSVLAIPMLCLTALLEEKRAAARAVAAQLSYEELLARLSASFVRLPSDQMASGFAACLERVGRFLDVDRTVLMQLAPSGDHLDVLSQWNRDGVAPLPAEYSCDAFPWVLGRLLNGQPVICPAVDDLPAEAEADRRAFAQAGLQSALVMPIVASGQVHGVLSLHVTRAPRAWPPGVLTQTELVAEVLGHALVRKRTEDAIRSSESMKSAILESLSSHVAVLDRRGSILAVNEGWRRAVGALATGASGRAAAEGDCYFKACREAAAHGYEPAAVTLEGVEGVLAGRREAFAAEYSYATAGGTRWCAVAAVPLQRADGGAVVSYTDITERKRAEIEVQRTRQELAQVTRVSTMGELTASLAHQLNQPLTGILSNAQAARRHLDRSPPNLDEVREIVLDIIEDDRRAGDVIRRLRELMTPADSEATLVDVHAVVRDVAMLTSSDAIIRNVSVSFDLAHGAAHVRGSRAELQQMLVHLLVNAMDAVANAPVPERTVTVKTERSDRTLLISVSDRGDGLAPGTERQIFEPFFTTKTSGIGMGLSITRSIVEAHDGRISAANQAGRGAVFSVHLPLASERVM